MAHDKKFIIGNWKMLPQSLAEAQDILDYLSDNYEPAEAVSLVLCPPFVFLEEVGKILQSSNLGDYAELGAQDIALAESGAWTGEISGPMLERLGVQYVIIGHSERRWKIGESNEVVNAKLKLALQEGLVPIVCIGERERDTEYQTFLAKQIEATFQGISSDQIEQCLIAYEPVWAISTNPNAKPDRPEDTLEAVQLIRSKLGETVRILYGGSVNQGNAKSFLTLEELSGVLVGGASVRKEEFVEILKMA